MVQASHTMAVCQPLETQNQETVFFTLPPPPPGFQRPPLPPRPRKIDPAPNRNDLGHYITSYMMNILSKFEIIVMMLEIIFAND